MSTQESSLSIIEDCLQQIYDVRKSALAARIRKFEHKRERDLVSKGYSPAAFAHNDGRRLNIHNEHEVEEEEDMTEDKKMLDELAGTFVPPPVTHQVPSIQTKESDDASADELFRGFCLEMKTGIQKCSENDMDEDLRADYCDYLVDKYLSNSLDALSSTLIVSSIRRIVASVIEEFASTGSVSNTDVLEPSYSLTGDKCDVLGVDNKDCTLESPELNVTLTPTSSKPSGVSPKISKSNALSEQQRTKEQEEKRKIQQQYETYLKLQQTDAGHPDNEVVEQFTQLNDELQSLIASIQRR